MSEDPSYWPLSGINLATTYIETSLDNNILANASGFFFKYQNIKYLVTNRHVIIDEEKSYYPDAISIFLHTSRTDAQLNNKVSINLYEEDKPKWHEHPNYKNIQYDVVLIPMDDIQIQSSLMNFFTTENFLGDRKLTAFADTIVVGYPLGFFDEENNLPIYRKAMIASPYPQHFSNKPYFLIDANLHQGTSGSPVINSPHNILFKESDGSGFHTQDIILLGIHSAEHLVDKEPLGLNVVWYAELFIDILK